MKLLIKWISPLLVCGLILTFYIEAHLIKGTHIKICVNHLKTRSASPALSDKMNDENFSFFRDVISNIAPVLKNLK